MPKFSGRFRKDNMSACYRATLGLRPLTFVPSGSLSHTKKFLSVPLARRGSSQRHTSYRIKPTSSPRAALALSEFREDEGQQSTTRISQVSNIGGDDTGLPLEFDQEAIEKYWNKRGTALTKRLVEVTAIFTPWILRVAADAAGGTLNQNGAKRAAELRDVLTTLGPTFVKLGQALSVRPDIIGPEAMNELRLLCDAVPSFANEIAFQMMEEELGRPIDEIYSEISEKPIAAASLGQVYKARLRSNGNEVAVKVQRPDMLRKVSLDLYCMKRVARLVEMVQAQFTAAQTDYTSLLLEWSKGTYKELDYENEAENSRRFASLVQARLPEVYVPEVYDQYTSRKVLTMEWINGRKLSECSPEQINALVSKGVECFLFQLLSAGFFHADPHTGNLIRLDNGQLCVIDFGLMAVIDKEEMDAMVSAIVHLANRDWPKVIEDFVILKFLPADIDTSKVEPVIGAILDQALEGGGANSINFQSLSDELATVTFDFPFSIPPAFALLLRALSVLEGIALVGDPQFKLIMESFPFVSRLIMTDRSPALRTALREILYKDGSFSPRRLRVLLDSSQGVINEGDAFVDFDTLSNNSKISRDAVDFLFSEEGLLIREILVEELAKGIDVYVRDAYHRTAVSFERSVPAPLRGFLRTPSLAVPLVPLPFMLSPEPFFALPPVDKSERAFLDNLSEIFEWVATDAVSSGVLQPNVILELLPEVVAKSSIIGRQVAGHLGERFLRRLFEDLLRGNGEVINGRRRITFAEKQATEGL
ncbi:Protein kinase [Gracilaria domingensis]|nr:Protein kinase [Gracilaria domingensis]